MSGGDWFNGVWTLIPDTCDSRVDPNRASLEGSLKFDLTSWRTYFQSLLVDMSPGIVLGSISAVGFLFFMLWMCVWFRRRKIIKRARRAKKDHRAGVKEAKKAAAAAEAEAAAAAAAAAAEQPKGQFIVAGEDGAAAAGAADGAASAGKQPHGFVPTVQHWWQVITAGRVLKWAILLFGLAVVGVASWGLAESIKATDDLVSYFWELVGEVNTLMVDLRDSLDALGASLGQVATTLGDVQRALEQVVAVKIPIVNRPIISLLPGGWGDKIEGFVGPDGTAQKAAIALSDAEGIVTDTIVPALNDTILPTIADLYRHEGWSMDLQDKWRYVVIAVLFGLLILVAAAVSGFCWTMRHGLTATALVATLWALNALVMFLGMGMLNGAQTAADDACLYTEDFIVRTLNDSLSGNGAVIAQNALEYYFGQVNLTDSQGNPLYPNATDCDPEVTAALLRQIADIDIASALVTAWSLADDVLPSLLGVLGGLNLPSVGGLNLNAIKAPVEQAGKDLDLLLSDVCNTTQLLIREARVKPLYVGIKTFICCDLTSSLYNVYVPWVTAGSLALVLSVLASGRVLQSTVQPTGRARYPQGEAANGSEAAVEGDAANGAAEDPAQA